MRCCSREVAWQSDAPQVSLSFSWRGGGFNHFSLTKVERKLISSMFGDWIQL